MEARKIRYVGRYRALGRIRQQLLVDSLPRVRVKFNNVSPLVRRTDQRPRQTTVQRRGGDARTKLLATRPEERTSKFPSAGAGLERSAGAQTR